MPDTTLEVNLERRLRDYVRRMGGSCTKFEAEKGLPDRIITLPGGTAFFVELKRDQGKLSPIQKRRIPELRNKGGIVAVMYGEAGLEQLTYEISMFDAAYTPTCSQEAALEHFNARLVYSSQEHAEYTMQRHFAGGLI